MKYPDLLNDDVARVGIQISRKYNLMAGRMITDVVKTALGPRGMEKMYIDIQGDATVTKHGGAFLRKVDVAHPAAKAVVDAANSVDTNVGDGTISVSVLLGALIKKAEELLELGISPVIIAKGYEKSLDISLETLSAIAKKSNPSDRTTMEQLVTSCLKGKAIFNMSHDEGSVTKIVVDAVCAITNFEKNHVDVDDIKIKEKPGNLTEMKLIRGTIIDKTIDSSDMPRKIIDAKILLTNEVLETMRTRTEGEITINSPEQMSLFLKEETNNILVKIRKIVDSGANVVISRKGIDYVAQQYLAKAGIISMQRVKANDLWWLEKSTGANTVEGLDNISGEDLGFAKKIYEKFVGDDKMVFVEGCRNPKSVTLLLRSNSKRYLDEFHRSALNAFFVLRNFIEKPLIVLGGGSTEAVIAHVIRNKASSIEGREQIVVKKFAEAMEEIPLTLARNVGMNTIDTLVELHSKYAGVSNGKYRWYGIDAAQRKIADMVPKKVIETLAVKEQIIKTAVEVTNLLVNVDDVFLKDEIDNTHCHLDGTVHAHRDGGKSHNHFEQEGIEQRQMHHYY